MIIGKDRNSFTVSRCSFRLKKGDTMSQITDTSRPRLIAGQTVPREFPNLNQEILQRITGLIQLGVGALNSLILLRFLLKLLAANTENQFAIFIYASTEPFLRMFHGLTSVLTVGGMVFELHDLIAIVVYGMLGWIIVRLLRVMFALIK